MMQSGLQGAGDARAGPAWKLRDLLALAAFSGTVCGLLEGAIQWVCQQHGWLGWNVLHAVRPAIMWIAPLLNSALFVCIAIPLALCSKLLEKKLRAAAFAIPIFTYAFLTSYDWTHVTGTIWSLGANVLTLGLTIAMVRLAGRNPAATQRFLRVSAAWSVVTILLAYGIIEGGERWRENSAVRALPPARPQAPNVLLIVVDTLRADHMSVDGYTRHTTPNLDALAARSVRFADGISTSSWTLPAHASLLTGLFPHEHGAEESRFTPRSPSLPEVLARNGYRTAGVSANHYYFGTREGFAALFQHFDDYFHSWANRALHTYYGRKFERMVLERDPRYEDYAGRKLASDVNREALAWLSQHPAVPFFLMLNYYDAHDPYVPPQPWRSKFAPGKRPGGVINGGRLQLGAGITPEQSESEVAAYDGAIAYVDDQIAVLLAQMEKQGFLKNTIVIVLSDHGEAFGERGYYQHRNALYRELVRVPIIIRWQGNLPEGLVVRHPVSITSLPATILQMAGLPANDSFRAPSLVPWWKGADEREGWPKPLSEIRQFRFEAARAYPNYYGGIQSLVGPEWHLIHHEKFGFELFDWKKDIAELQNLARNTEAQPVVGELAAELEEQRGNGHPPTPPH